MTSSTSSTDKWEPKYLQRLASVYLQKYDTLGYEEAKSWYKDFLSPELQVLVRPIIQDLVVSRGAKKK